MIHMFDYCTNNLDFRNVEHLACTEIRAANLAHCSFLGAYAQTDATMFNIKKRHRVSDFYAKSTNSCRNLQNFCFLLIYVLFVSCLQDCVKSKAVYSVLSVRRDITKEKAIEIVEKVFPKCYADLEPIGRRIRSGSSDAERAYEESKQYGFTQ